MDENYINILPDELLLVVVRGGFREIICLVCRRWNALCNAASPKWERIKNKKEFCRPEIYRAYEPEIFDTEAALLAENWECYVHSFFTGRFAVQPHHGKSIILRLVEHGRRSEVTRLVETFPKEVPVLAVTDIPSIAITTSTTETLYRLGYITTESGLLDFLMKRGYWFMIWCVLEIKPDLATTAVVSPDVIIGLIHEFTRKVRVWEKHGIIVAVRVLCEYREYVLASADKAAGVAGAAGPC